MAMVSNTTGRQASGKAAQQAAQLTAKEYNVKKAICNVSVSRVNGRYTMSVKMDPRLEALLGDGATVAVSSKVFLVNADGSNGERATYYGQGGRVADCIRTLQAAGRPASSELPARIIQGGVCNLWPLRIKGSSSEQGVTFSLPVDQLYSEAELTEYIMWVKGAVSTLFSTYIKALVIKTTVEVIEG